jgi:hypothetical protein
MRPFICITAEKALSTSCSTPFSCFLIMLHGRCVRVIYKHESYTNTLILLRDHSRLPRYFPPPPKCILRDKWTTRGVSSDNPIAFFSNSAMILQNSILKNLKLRGELSADIVRSRVVGEGGSCRYNVCSCAPWKRGSQLASRSKMILNDMSFRCESTLWVSEGNNRKRKACALHRLAHWLFLCVRMYQLLRMSFWTCCGKITRIGHQRNK